MKDLSILIIDDDILVRRLIQSCYQDSGAKTYTAADGNEGLHLFFDVRPDLIILDVMMPDMDGFEVCRQIRQFSETPIILLTALSADEQIIRGLNYGADDFITKPVSPKVLLARSKAVLRRIGQARKTQPAIVYNDNRLTIDPDKRLVLINGEPLKMTPTEFNLLQYLLQNAGRVCTFKQILQHVWGWEYQDSFDYVHVYVSHLRGKIEIDPGNPKYIITVYGIGYRFEE
jgi:two-component system KDP operon response regulator KdpE